MSQNEFIEVLVKSHIMRILINRPAKKNALTQGMYEAMSAAVIDADAREDVRVVVLQGHETCFTAGNDLADFNSRDPNELSNAIKMLLVFHDMKKPLLASVCGLAVGVGTTLLLHCDLVYAANNTRFRLPFVNLGLCPEAGSSLLLPAIAGHRLASELLLMGDFFDTDAAVKSGLVNQSLPPEQVSAHTMERAAQLASRPQEAVIESKRLMKSHTHDAVKACLLDEAKVFSRLLASEESIAARGQALG